MPGFARMEEHGGSVNFGSFVGSATIRSYAKDDDAWLPDRRGAWSS